MQDIYKAHYVTFLAKIELYMSFIFYTYNFFKLNCNINMKNKFYQYMEESKTSLPIVNKGRYRFESKKLLYHNLFFLKISNTYMLNS